MQKRVYPPLKNQPEALSKENSSVAVIPTPMGPQDNDSVEVGHFKKVHRLSNSNIVKSLPHFEMEMGEIEAERITDSIPSLRRSMSRKNHNKIIPAADDNMVNLVDENASTRAEVETVR
ncbi:predicted protein [Naegleria gruberi]|uniref:Predicted protein n=1 Tax=Naegleria gruberi TaxID=5762 RepID=D2V1D1_NAEGR|nr:uncharacterized protein NAEGRDRAFT_62537 [Naegleria gruberi]EFC49144.1 predicted protein [Naegleria gruberi]|eukprot:XP_002681888.1 predicted protein [Naegleria gruberi strain NEG-M]